MTRNQKLAMRINSLEVALMMQRTAEKNGNDESLQLWTRAQMQIEVELADEFGIELPGLKHARDYMEREKANS